MAPSSLNMLYSFCIDWDNHVLHDLPIAVYVNLFDYLYATCDHRFIKAFLVSNGEDIGENRSMVC